MKNNSFNFRIRANFAWRTALLIFVASVIPAVACTQAASGDATGIAGGFTTGFPASGFSGGSPAQDLDAAGIDAAVGGVCGGHLFGWAGFACSPGKRGNSSGVKIDFWRVKGRGT